VSISEAMTALADAMGVALFPPRCGGCAGWLNARPRFGLCDVCFEVLEPNAGARCARCDVPLDGGQPTCTRCATDPPAFDALRAPYLYGGPLAQVVASAKFAGREDLCRALAELLAADPAARALAAEGTLVPVPLGRARARRRGYNPAAVIARVASVAWGRPVRHALRRTRETGVQSSLDAAARRANVAGAFAVRRPVEGVVVLVDDVVTSTETVRQCAAALGAAGATSVRVLAAARAVVQADTGRISSHTIPPELPR